MDETFLLQSLAYLRIQVGQFEHENHYDCRLGLSSSCICLLERGSLHILSGRRRLHAEPGDIIFFPQSVPYHSDWSGAKGVSFIAIHYLISAYRIRQNDTGHTNPNSLLSIARESVRISNCDYFVCLSPDQCRGAAHIISNIMQIHKDDSRSLEATALFYSLYHLVKPLLPTTKPTPDRLRSEEICQYLQVHCIERLSMARVAKHFHMSESRLYHLFKDQTGLSPIEFKNHARIHKAISLLDADDLTIEAISEQMNFSAPSYFRRVFRQVMGTSPSAYRNCACINL